MGRYLVEDFCDEAGNVLIPKTKLMTEADAKLIKDAGVKRIKFRSPLPF